MEKSRHSCKDGSLLQKRVKPVKGGYTLKKWVIYGKKVVTLGKMDHTWKNWSH